ncbi:MAG: hypothetical protein FRX48_07015 [Lasallia pustulata]|uniref:Uncharacterized protein n=1 Tax=Lasallia pustulata TaxID=136370 RepID=A0A5M8PJ56_9LECA|nr:MAG: hypothetical protein FRX48_07015 [Lasallia pustulata]
MCAIIEGGRESFSVVSFNTEGRRRTLGLPVAKDFSHPTISSKSTAKIPAPTVNRQPLMTTETAIATMATEATTFIANFSPPTKNPPFQAISLGLTTTSTVRSPALRNNRQPMATMSGIKATTVRTFLLINFCSTNSSDTRSNPSSTSSSSSSSLCCRISLNALSRASMPYAPTTLNTR